jgi:hypothetical protein
MSDEFNDGRNSFYYSRENRLKKAPRQVQDLYKPEVKRKPNLFRTLTATTSLRFLFISVITICAAILILSRFLYVEGVRVLGNNTVTVSVIGAGENSYVSVKKTMAVNQKNNPGMIYSGPVDIAVSIPGEGNPIYSERIYFGPDEDEIFRIIVPFRGKKLIVLLEAGPEQVHCTVSSK